MRKSLEYLDTITLAAASTDYSLTNGIPNDYAMAGIILDVSWRDVVAVAATAAPFLGSPFSFLSRITIEGQLIGKGKVTLVDLTGRQAMQMYRACSGKMPYFDPDNFIVGAGATGTYDMRVRYVIPFTAINAGFGSEMATLLPGNMFSNPLTLRVTRGAGTCLANQAGGSTQTFTAYGSASGSPTMTVHRIVIKQGLGTTPRIPLMCMKTRQGPFTTATAATNALVGRLNTGNLIGRILLVNGALDTTTTSELSAGSLSNLTRIYLTQNQQPIRNFLFREAHYQGADDRGLNLLHGIYLTAQGMSGGTGGFGPAEMLGDCLIDFIPDGSLDDALNTVGWSAQGQSLQLQADITALTAGVVEVITEEYQRLA